MSNLVYRTNDDSGVAADILYAKDLVVLSNSFLKTQEFKAMFNAIIKSINYKIKESAKSSYHERSFELDFNDFTYKNDILPDHNSGSYILVNKFIVNNLIKDLSLHYKSCGFRFKVSKLTRPDIYRERYTCNVFISWEEKLSIKDRIKAFFKKLFK